MKAVLQICDDNDLDSTSLRRAPLSMVETLQEGQHFILLDMDKGIHPWLEADFISCVTLGKSAEFVQKYLHKGMRIAISGRISTRG